MKKFIKEVFGLKNLKKAMLAVSFTEFDITGDEALNIIEVMKESLDSDDNDDEKETQIRKAS